MALDINIKGSGIISVMGNIVPKTINEMVRFALAGKKTEAEALEKMLKPLFSIGTIITEEDAGIGMKTKCRHRNPLPIKTLAALLGIPVGPCRAPLGRMTKQGFEIVWSTARQVWDKTPEILQPAADFFGLKIKERLSLPIGDWEGTLYDAEY
jgi:4-hydroxy-tetrahydrodipicolinate synthase